MDPAPIPRDSALSTRKRVPGPDSAFSLVRASRAAACSARRLVEPLPAPIVRPSTPTSTVKASWVAWRPWATVT